MFPGAVVELARIGALDRVLALGAPRMPEAAMSGAGVTVRAGYTAVEGVDYALCVRRTGLDAALVERAREAGADVREGARVTDLVWSGGGGCGGRGGRFRPHRAPGGGGGG